ncbi:MAG: helix-hairpin-helix domain-containing protein, partial [Gammaproteobacteria bacterium]|nr:helix-hairpin-helix domain-containing protein [Gammaproteobacteria bacterium]
GDLNINTATAQEIANALVGVGSVKAQAIIALRDQLGGFTDINQLLEVKGIGSSTIERISDQIVLE